MKVLFVCSGNSNYGISPIIKSQGDSLTKTGIVVDYYTIKGKGARLYLKNVILLKKYLRANSFDLVHAHYSLSAFVASLAGATPLVVSLMGSDVKAGWIQRRFIFLFYVLFWKVTIVKSTDMKSTLGIPGLKVVPNGVDINIFRTLDKKKCREKLGWHDNKSHLLFLADPNRPEKNFILAKEAIRRMQSGARVELHFLTGVSHDEVPVYINGSDVCILSSLWEGSPNVIKEVMACNRPIVSTIVGDVIWLFGETEGCHLSSFTPEEMSEAIKAAINFGSETNGRQRILELSLDSDKVAARIIEIYNEINLKN